MNLFDFSIFDIVIFLFALFRVGAIMFFFPFTGDNTIPAPVKILLSVAITFIVIPIIGKSNVNITLRDIDSLFFIVTNIAKELAFGLILGFCANLVFYGVAFAAQFIGLQMGFGTASVYDPNFNMQSSEFSKFYTSLAMLLFLSLDGHHIFIHAIRDSFETVIIGKAHFNESLKTLIIGFTSDVFVVAFKLSAPIALVIMFINVALGILARSVPQMNIFVVSMSLNISVGLIVMIISLPMFSDVLNTMFHQMFKGLHLVVRSLSG